MKQDFHLFKDFIKKKVLFYTNSSTGVYKVYKVM